ncbi:integration host factor subunit beta [Anaplasma platys]|uniref:Integration host factor subunit beta n=1 Tax=Anaplasma platys TaxID=949 RepID=A0A858PXP0_9RICK|nr:integration host factor subunit beta [Anaplasma platys]
MIRRLARRNSALGEPVVAQILDIFFGSILQSIREETRVELRGFGSFSARNYVLQSSTEGLHKMRYRRIYFRPSEKLIKAVNSGNSKSEN